MDSGGTRPNPNPNPNRPASNLRIPVSFSGSGSVPSAYRRPRHGFLSPSLFPGLFPQWNSSACGSNGVDVHLHALRLRGGLPRFRFPFAIRSQVALSLARSFVFRFPLLISFTHLSNLLSLILFSSQKLAQIRSFRLARPRR